MSELHSAALRKKNTQQEKAQRCGLCLTSQIPLFVTETTHVYPVTSKYQCKCPLLLQSMPKPMSISHLMPKKDTEVSMQTFRGSI